MENLLERVKAYARIDYDDDDEGLLADMIEATLQTMQEVIPRFDKAALTARQRLILCTVVKDLYDNRDKYGAREDKLRAAASSMLLSERYEPEVGAGV